MLRAEDPPLSPGGDQARDLLRHELAKPEYHERKSLVQTVVDWVLERLGEVLSGSTGTLPALAWLVGLLLVIAAIALAVFGLRRGRVSSKVDGARSVLGETTLTADDLRRRADRARGAGDHSAASLDYMRAVAARGVERALVAASPGLTAYEVARQLTVSFPDQERELAAAATTFDEILYGGRSGDERTSAALGELDERLRRTRPRIPAGGPG